MPQNNQCHSTAAIGAAAIGSLSATLSQTVD